MSYSNLCCSDWWFSAAGAYCFLRAFFARYCKSNCVDLESDIVISLSIEPHKIQHRDPVYETYDFCDDTCRCKDDSLCKKSSAFRLFLFCHIAPHLSHFQIIGLFPVRREFPAVSSPSPHVPLLPCDRTPVNEAYCAR